MKPERISVGQLSEYLDGHGILTISCAERVCQFVGVSPASIPRQIWTSRQDAIEKFGFVPKEDAPGQGVDSVRLSYYLCEQLQIDAPGRCYIGDGKQARANKGAILQELSRRGLI